MYTYSQLGTVSFILSGTISYRTADLCAVNVSSRASRRRKARSCDPLETIWLQPAMLLIVAANYTLPLVLLALPPTFQTYLVAGASFWALAALRTYKLLARAAASDGDGLTEALHHDYEAAVDGRTRLCAQ